jgi:hypothetical protein
LDEPARKQKLQRHQAFMAASPEIKEAGQELLPGQPV